MNQNLLSWLLYDFGNSFLSVATGSLYFAQWVIIDNGFDDIWYGGAMVVATLLVLALSPLLGAWSDREKKRLPFLKWLTLLLIITNAFLVLIVNINFDQKVRVLGALSLFVFVQLFYQLSLIFYNALLEILSSEKSRGKISGLGLAFGNGGWIVATVLLLPFSQGKIKLLGIPGRTQVFLPAFLIFSFLTFPLLLGFREASKAGHNLVGSGWGSLRKLLREDINTGYFLLGFCLISDAMLTVQMYFAVVMEKLFGIPDAQKIYIIGLMMLFTVLGNYFLGRWSDFVGAKTVVLASTFLLVISLFLAFLSSSPTFLYFLAAFLGLGYAGFSSASRALLIKISPKERLGSYFGFYSAFERFASIIGPLVWGVVTLLLKDFGNIKYRVAGFSLILLMIFGLFVLKNVKERIVTVGSSNTS